MKKNKINQKIDNQAIIDKTFEIVAKIFNEQGFLRPTLFLRYSFLKNIDKSENNILGYKDGLGIIIDDFRPENKFKILRIWGIASAFLNKLNLVGNPTNITIVSESWVSIKDKNNTELEYTEPSKDPNKKESVVVCLSNGKEVFIKMKYITRIKKEINLRDADIDKEIETKSPLLNEYWNGYNEMINNFKNSQNIDFITAEAKTKNDNELFKLVIDAAKQSISLLNKNYI